MFRGLGDDWPGVTGGASVIPGITLTPEQEAAIAQAYREFAQDALGSAAVGSARGGSGWPGTTGGAQGGSSWQSLIKSQFPLSRTSYYPPSEPAPASPYAILKNPVVIAAGIAVGGLVLLKTLKG